VRKKTHVNSALFRVNASGAKNEDVYNLIKQTKNVRVDIITFNNAKLLNEYILIIFYLHN